MKFKYWLFEIIKTIIVGCLIGALIALYRYASYYVIYFNKWLFLDLEPIKTSLGIVGLVFLGILSGFLIKFDGNIQGSGLPQLEKNIEHKAKTIRWYSIPLMFINSLISFFAGLPVGGEGPSTFMGGVISLASNRVIKHENEDDDIPIGMGVGFGVAMMSPISGVLYSFEECLKQFKWNYLWKAPLMMFCAIVIAYFINPNSTILLPITVSFDYKYIWIFLFIIAINFIIAKTIIIVMPLIKGFINNNYKNIILRNRFFIMYAFSVILMLCLPVLMGNGGNLINELSAGNIAYYLAVIYLFVRMILFILIGDSMASGGLMIPSLALGAVVGYLANGIILQFNPSDNYLNLLIVISMLSLFTMLNSTPLTSLALSISFGGYTNFLNIIVPSLITIGLSFVLIKLTKTPTLNDSRKKMLRTSRTIRYID